MAIERKWLAVPPVALTATGTSMGVLALTSTSGFKVKMIVTLTGLALPTKKLEVKRVVSPTVLEVGPPGDIDAREDVSAYPATTSFLSAYEQKRNTIPLQEMERAVYEEEPTVAKRVVLVDEFGNKISEDNPLPTNATFTGELSVSLDAFTATPDNVLVVGTEDGTKTGTKRVFVNNITRQIMSAHDKHKVYSYSTVGSSKRLDYIDFSSSTIGSGPGFTARVTLTWADFGTKNERIVDAIWSLI